MPMDDPSQEQIAALTSQIEELRREQAALRERCAQAEAARQAQTVFLGNLSHEIRSPLNSMLGFAEMMADGLYGPVTPEQEQRLARVLKNGHALVALLTQVLDLARMESGRIELAPIAIRLPVLLRTVAAALEPAARAKGLALRVEIDPGLETIRIDVDRARQLLGNLLDNAIRYTEQGAVTLRAAPHPTRAGFVRLAVADTGPGIPPAVAARLGAEFYQIDLTRRGPGGGAGLGLAISYRLAALLGGALSLDSREEAGTCVYVDLPVGNM